MKKKTKKGYKIKPRDIVFVLIAVFMIGFILGTHLSPIKEKIIEIEKIRYISNVSNGKTVSMLVPAVNAEGNGVVANLITSVRPGSGLVMVSVNDVLAQYDTQLSGRIAAKVAENYTEIDMNAYDVIYSMKVNASAIEGPSAGAAMTISIISALQNKTLDPAIMITGSIYEGGYIGQAGAITEKLAAAKENNITTFLVPVNQSYQYDVRRDRKCETKNSIEYCSINYIQEKISIGEENITIIEVSNIKEAMEYFFIEVAE